MKNIIKKILKEDFDWIEENQIDLPPIQDIHIWCENNRHQISKWIQQIDEFYKQSPQMDWDVDQNGDELRMIALSVKGIGDELRNIYHSFDTIGREIDYIQNPEDYND